LQQNVQDKSWTPIDKLNLVFGIKIIFLMSTHHLFLLYGIYKLIFVSMVDNYHSCFSGVCNRNAKG